MILSKLSVLNAFSIYDLFNLQWFIRIQPHCKLRSIYTYKSENVG